MGGYTLHPRLRSLTVAQKDESEDPVSEHIAAAEALFREGFQTRVQVCKTCGKSNFSSLKSHMNFVHHVHHGDDPEGRLPEAPVWFSYVENESLAERFRAKKEEFEQDRLHSYPYDDEPVLLFHGTSFDNTDGICRTNFNLDAMSRFAFGRGIYLSKYPTTSLLYGEALVVCKVLLGRRQATDATRVADGITAVHGDTEEL